MSVLTAFPRKMPRAAQRYFSTSPSLLSASASANPSHAYHIPHNPAAGPSRPPPPPPATRATTEKPVLAAEEQEVIDRIVRVDQAGELGANWIYRGQKMAMGLRGDRKAVKQIDEMWESEKHHLNVMSTLQTQFQTRPTILYPLWQVMAFGLGAGTGLMGREAAMACTEAVETVIGEHYDDQMRELTPILAKMSAEQAEGVHPSLPLLKQILEEFRDDELEHLDTAVEEGAQRAPGHALLGAVIGWGCKAAIGVCKRI